MSEPRDLKVPNHTVYDSMQFPDYEFREFPMGIPVHNGKIMDSPYDGNHKAYPVVIVESQAELEALRGPEVTLVPVKAGDTTMRVESEDDVRAALYIQAEQTGATIDKTWSVPRIEDTIKRHVAGLQAQKAVSKGKATADVV